MIVNHLAKELCACIVFVGPPGSGKRTVMSHFQHLAQPRGKITWTDAGQAALDAGAVSFDFIPPGLGTIDGYTVRLYFDMPPDPLGWPELFERAVKNADAITFIADTRSSSITQNRAVMRALEKLIDRTRVPVVFFFNKRDVPDVIPVADLGKALGVDGAPSFEGNATEKAGTVAVKAAVRAAILRHQGKPFW